MTQVGKVRDEVVPGDADEFAADPELVALMRALRYADGFSLLIVIADHVSHVDRVIDRLSRQFGEPLTYDLSTDSADDVAEAPEALGDRSWVSVRGLDHRVTPAGAVDSTLGALNLNRDHLAVNLEAPMVVWLPQWAVRPIASAAPDLWSVRSGTYDLRAATSDIRSTVDTMRSQREYPADGAERTRRAAVAEWLVVDPDHPAKLRADTLVEQARGALAGDNLDAAAERFGEALPIYRDIGDRLGEANTIRSLGDVDLRQGRYGAAAERFGEALPIYRDIGDRLGEATTIRSLGDVDLRQGRYGAAAERSGEALPIYREIGVRVGEAMVSERLAELSERSGNHEDAEQRRADAARARAGAV